MGRAQVSPNVGNWSELNRYSYGTYGVLINTF